MIVAGDFVCCLRASKGYQGALSAIDEHFAFTDAVGQIRIRATIRKQCALEDEPTEDVGGGCSLQGGVVGLTFFESGWRLTTEDADSGVTTTNALSCIYVEARIQDINCIYLGKYSTGEMI